MYYLFDTFSYNTFLFDITKCEVENTKYEAHIYN